MDTSIVSCILLTPLTGVNANERWSKLFRGLMAGCRRLWRVLLVICPSSWYSNWMLLRFKIYDDHFTIHHNYFVQYFGIVLTSVSRNLLWYCIWCYCSAVITLLCCHQSVGFKSSQWCAYGGFLVRVKKCHIKCITTSEICIPAYKKYWTLNK